MIKLKDKERVKSLMDDIYNYLSRLLKENLVGVYFHGSLRLGSFNYHYSDLDFIIVIKNKLNYREKEKICNYMIANWHKAPKKGYEFSVILEQYCKNFVYPTPYELHLSEGWLERYTLDKTMVINDTFKTDVDLASHFNVINQNNRFLDYGKASEEVFEKVPKCYIIESNYSDIQNAKEDILQNPVYVLLNLSRFYAFIVDDLTLSKYYGGKWLIENTDFLTERQIKIIQNCMNFYDGSEKTFNYANEELQNLAITIKEIIDKKMGNIAK